MGGYTAEGGALGSPGERWGALERPGEGTQAREAPWGAWGSPAEPLERRGQHERALNRRPDVVALDGPGKTSPVCARGRP